MVVQKFARLPHKTIIFITHDLDEALKLTDPLVILKEGFVVQLGEPQHILLNPNHPYIEDFVTDISRARVLRLPFPTGFHQGRGRLTPRGDVNITCQLINGTRARMVALNAAYGERNTSGLICRYWRYGQLR